MKVVTHTGRFGDILWALPSIRAIAEVHGPVHLHVPGEFASLGPLLLSQPYIAEFSSDDGWNPGVQGWQAPQHPDAWHLGYRAWPTDGLPYVTYQTAVEVSHEQIAPLDLTTPWISQPGYPSSAWKPTWTFGFTETWFELKFGLVELLDRRSETDLLWIGASHRWREEAEYLVVAWLDAARWIAASCLLLTDCSALHVLGVALGVPVLIVEPMEARWNPIFWPLGMDGPQVTCVKGGDGRPTFDARHVRDALEAMLSAARAGGTR